MTSPDPLKLNLAELAALVVLMSEDRELSNPEMEALAGFSLTGPARTNLVKAGLIKSEKRGRSFAHTLTDKGWAECRRLASVPRPAGPKAAVGALLALLGGVQRSLERSRLSHGEFFHQADETLETRIRSVYAELAGPAGGFVTLADVRDRLAAVDRSALDAALRRMSREPEVFLQPATNMKALTERERSGAVGLAGEDNHIISIE